MYNMYKMLFIKLDTVNYLKVLARKVYFYGTWIL